MTEADRFRLLLPELAPDSGAVAPAAPTDRPTALAQTRALQLGRQFVRLQEFTREAWSEEEARGTPFLFVPVFLGLGAIAYFAADAEPGWPAILLCLLLLGVVQLVHARAGRKAYPVMALMLVAAGMTAAKLETGFGAGTMLAGEISTTATLRVRTLEPDGRGVRVVADVIASEKPVLKHAPERVRVTLRRAPEGLKPGDGIKARLRLGAPSGPVRVNGYDFAFHAYFAGIGVTGFSIGTAEPVNIAPPGPIDRARFAIETLRLSIAARIRTVITGTDGSVAAALIAGVTGGIDDDTTEAMRLTGLAHVLSISGLHMALVAGVFMAAIRFGFAFFPGVAARLPVKKYAAAVALAASFFYLLLSGAGVATVRSFVMIAVMLAAVMVDREALTLRNLAIAAILVLAVEPHEIMGPSFQMSFAATAALISAYAAMTRARAYNSAAERGNWMARGGRAAAVILLTPLVAGLATGLFAAWHFQRLSPMSLPANLAALPAISFVIMPSAIVSALAMPFGLESWPLWVMGKGVAAMLAIARFFAAYSPSGVSGGLSPAGFMAASAWLTGVCLLQTRLRFGLLAILPLVAALFVNPPRPSLLISEDGRLAAHAGDAGMAVNRKRPNPFTVENWQRAAGDLPLILPVAADKPGTVDDLLAASARTPARFVCAASQCALTTADGVQVLWLDWQEPDLESRGPDRSAAIIRQACGKADLLIANLPLPFKACAKGEALLVTAQQLALNGMAEVTFAEQTPDEAAKPGNNAEPSAYRAGAANLAKGRRISIVHAVGAPVRPWNRERVFSRAARNMPPFIPKPRPQSPAPPQNAPER